MRPLLALLAATVLAAEPRVVLDDPLAGGTAGERRGGSFRPGGGWAPSAAADQIVWTLPAAIGDGALELDLINFDPTRQRPSERGWLLGLWETLWASGGSVDRPNHDSIYLRFERKPGRLMTKISTHGFSFFEKEARFAEPDWDPARTYRLRIAWRAGVVTLAVDGREVVSWRSPAYDPIDRFRYVTLGSVVGSEARQNGTWTGPAYANVRLTAFSPAPPADRSPRITGPARVMPDSAWRVVLADDLRAATRGAAEGGRFAADGGWTATDEKDRIVWTLPEPIRHGAVEVDVRNFDPARQLAGRQSTVFVVWEKPWISGGALDEPGLDCALWRVNRTDPQFYIELCLRGISIYNRAHAPLAGGFDPAHTYRLRTEWIDGRVSLAIDGVPFAAWQSPDYDPFDAVRVIHVGGEPRSESLRGPVFSRLRVLACNPLP